MSRNKNSSSTVANTVINNSAQAEAFIAKAFKDAKVLKAVEDHDDRDALELLHGPEGIVRHGVHLNPAFLVAYARMLVEVVENGAEIRTIDELDGDIQELSEIATQAYIDAEVKGELPSVKGLVMPNGKPMGLPPGFVVAFTGSWPNAIDVDFGARKVFLRASVEEDLEAYTESVSDGDPKQGE